jgi:hypothetical protein
VSHVPKFHRTLGESRKGKVMYGLGINELRSQSNVVYVASKFWRLLINKEEGEVRQDYKQRVMFMFSLKNPKFVVKSWYQLMDCI